MYDIFISMSQAKLWQKRWSSLNAQLRPNNFARRAFALLKPSHNTLLDLGCGNGQDSMYFAKKGLKVTAVDWAESGLDNVRKIAVQKNIKSLEVVQQNLTHLDFPAHSFDVIYAHLSLHYFDDQTTKEIFNGVYRILKKDGLLFVKCKSVDDRLYGHGTKLQEDMYEYRGHIRHFFTKEYMSSLLEKFQKKRIRKTSSVYVEYKGSYIEAVAKK